MRDGHYFYTILPTFLDFRSLILKVMRSCFSTSGILQTYIRRGMKQCTINMYGKKSCIVYFFDYYIATYYNFHKIFLSYLPITSETITRLKENGVSFILHPAIAMWNRLLFIPLYLFFIFLITISFFLSSITLLCQQVWLGKWGRLCIASLIKVFRKTSRKTK